MVPRLAPYAATHKAADATAAAVKGSRIGAVSPVIASEGTQHPAERSSEGPRASPWIATAASSRPRDDGEGATDSQAEARPQRAGLELRQTLFGKAGAMERAHQRLKAEAAAQEALLRP